MSPTEHREHDWHTYEAYLADKRINLAPDLGVAATTGLLAVVTLGTMEAAQPRSDEFFGIKSAETVNRALGEMTLDSTSDRTITAIDFASTGPSPVTAAQHAIDNPYLPAAA